MSSSSSDSEDDIVDRVTMLERGVLSIFVGFCMGVRTVQLKRHFTFVFSRGCPHGCPHACAVRRSMPSVGTTGVLRSLGTDLHQPVRAEIFHFILTNGRPTKS